MRSTSPSASQTMHATVSMTAITISSVAASSGGMRVIFAGRCATHHRAVVTDPGFLSRA